MPGQGHDVGGAPILWDSYPSQPVRCPNVVARDTPEPSGWVRLGHCRPRACGVRPAKPLAGPFSTPSFGPFRHTDRPLIRAQRAPARALLIDPGTCAESYALRRGSGGARASRGHTPRGPGVSDRTPSHCSVTQAAGTEPARRAGLDDQPPGRGRSCARGSAQAVGAPLLGLLRSSDDRPDTSNLLGR